MRLIALLLLLIPGLAFAFTPEMHYRPELDRDGNRIADDLDRALASAIQAGSTKPIPILVSLYGPPQDEQLAAFRGMGGRVTHRFSHAIYGFAGDIPPQMMSLAAEKLGGDLCLIEADRFEKMQGMDSSIQMIRVRPHVWDTYGLDGDPGIVVAIVDGGVDTTHADLLGKMQYWWVNPFLSPASHPDPGGHGTYIAGVIAGTGVSGGPSMSTMTLRFGNPNLYSDFDWTLPLDAPIPGTIGLDFIWLTSGLVNYEFLDSSGTSLGGGSSSSGSILDSRIASVPGPYSIHLWASGGNFSNRSGLATLPWSPINDGHNQMRGVAPASNLASFRVFDTNGYALNSDIIRGFEAVVQARLQEGIKVVNYSGGTFDSVSPSTDQAAENCMNAGVVFVGIAQNFFPDQPILSPGRAPKIITTGAINDLQQATDYSCVGSAGSNKPDIVAPGGTGGPYSWGGRGRLFMTESNQDDYGLPDRQLNDYRASGSGTSFAAPHVAGLAALVIDAMATYESHTWSYTSAEALRVKNIILTTATETNQPRELGTGTDPTLDRGGHDLVEGFGRVNADAAIETIVNHMTAGSDSVVTINYEDHEFGRWAWATEITVCDSAQQSVLLSVPATADLDLFLYDHQGDGNGRPILLASSVNPNLGDDESITLPSVPSCTQMILVAKRVSGHGQAFLRSPSILSADDRGPTPVAVSLSAIRPNPMRGQASISFTVGQAGPVQMRLFDVSGRLVRVLQEGQLAEGAHEITWDGRNDSGHNVGAGIYFVRLRGGGVEETRRLVRVQ